MNAIRKATNMVGIAVDIGPDGSTIQSAISKPTNEESSKNPEINIENNELDVDLNVDIFIDKYSKLDISEKLKITDKKLKLIKLLKKVKNMGLLNLITKIEFSDIENYENIMNLENIRINKILELEECVKKINNNLPSDCRCPALLIEVLTDEEYRNKYNEDLNLYITCLKEHLENNMCNDREVLNDDFLILENINVKNNIGEVIDFINNKSDLLEKIKEFLLYLFSIIVLIILIFIVYKYFKNSIVI